MTTTYGVENATSGLGWEQKCGGVCLLEHHLLCKGISVLLLSKFEGTLMLQRLYIYRLMTLFTRFSVYLHS